MKVFIADESKVVRERIISLINNIEGVEIIGQTKDLNSYRHIKSIIKLKPDVMILDIRILGNGIKVLKMIREQTITPIVIILSSYTYPQYKEKCIKAGADFFLNKHTDYERIPGLLREFIE